MQHRYSGKTHNQGSRLNDGQEHERDKTGEWFERCVPSIKTCGPSHFLHMGFIQRPLCGALHSSKVHQKYHIDAVANQAVDLMMA